MASGWELVARETNHDQTIDTLANTGGVFNHINHEALKTVRMTDMEVTGGWSA